MHDLAMFIPLAKADAAKRLVWGFFDETPDRAGEVCDYATAKPAFMDWSDSLSKATNGENLGNIRAQHDLKKAAGKLVEITYDDEAKRIGFCAKIVDDAEWAKVEQCVYTGFSPGGSYAKRWQDGSYRRYTPKVGELSIVDVPCNPSATFTMVKADGTETEVEFVLAKAYEPGNEATIARSEELAKAVGPNAKPKDYVVKARADLIAANADAALVELAKADEPAGPVTEPVEHQPVVEPAADPVASLTAALAKANAAIPVVEPVEAEIEAEAPAANPLGDIQLEDYAKGLDAIVLANTPEGDAVMIKGLRTISMLSGAIYKLVGVHSMIAREAATEGDSSPVPGQIAAGIKALTDSLVSLAQEEVAELLTEIGEGGMISDAYCWDSYACAAPIVDLIKADTALMEKAGARNSRSDATKIQTMHDNAVDLGAKCEAAVAKVDELAAENERLTKAFGDAVPQIETLTKALESQAAEIVLLKAQPAPPKGAIMALTKEQDNGAPALNKSDSHPLADISAMPNGMAKANALISKVGTLSKV